MGELRHRHLVKPGQWMARLDREIERILPQFGDFDAFERRQMGNESGVKPAARNLGQQRMCQPLAHVQVQQRIIRAKAREAAVAGRTARPRV